MSAQDFVNILLVDDLPARLLSYEVILSELGENLLVAGSAREAFEHLLRNDVAVVITDVSMPELDGFGLASMIREHPRFQHIPIIFVSGIHVTDLDFLRGYQAGAVDYVSVPVIPEVLRAKVKIFVELFRKTRELERWNIELEGRVAARTAELERANSELEERVVQRTREREEALARVLEMKKMESIGQLTGGVAHDFNNLLMVILGNLELIKRRSPENPRTKPLLDGAIAAAHRGASLTNRMLAFARRQELKPETGDLREIVQGMSEMIRQSIGPEIDFELSFGEGNLSITVDKNQLELALLNLAVNARDAMPGKGRLSLSIRNSKRRDDEGVAEHVCLSLTDTGVGMDEETLKRAIEPFYTTKGVGKGTGLGLSMVHGLAAQSGGRCACSAPEDKARPWSSGFLWRKRAPCPRASRRRQGSSLRNPCEFSWWTMIHSC
jgi:signal transduction histidine kinase